MKKVLVIILSFIIILSTFLNVKGLEDNNPPTLTAISINKKTLSGGENITFNVTGDDDLTGLQKVMIEYELSTNHSKLISIEFENTSSSNKFSSSYKLPEKTLAGDWKATAIQIWDKSGKRNIYYSSDTSVNFSNINFTVLENKNYDTAAPIFKDVSVSKKSVSAPGQFYVTVKASDNMTSKLHVQVSYDIAGNEISFTGEYISSNTYKAIIDVPEGAKYKPIKLIYIVLTDEAKNQTWVSYNPENITHVDSSVRINKNIDVTVTNGVSDTKAPVLNGYSYNPTDVLAPGSMKFLFDVSDDISGVSKVQAYFKGYDKNDKLITDAGVIAYAPAINGKFVADCVFNQYYPEATFYIDSITVYDVAGNKSKYSIYGVGGDIKIEKKEFKLKKAIVSDVSTGTMKDDYLDTISSAKNDSVITVDCTKNHIIDEKAFSNIKGTNKTLILVNDGIQWIFKGSDIKNPIKKINTSVKIYAFDEFDNRTLIECFTEGSKGMVIEFASNGLLPGKTQIKIKADYTFRNYIGDSDLYVYHYNDDGLETIAEKIDITSDGFYQFYITHNSKYIISKQKAKTSSIVKDSTSTLGNQSDPTKNIENNEEQNEPEEEKNKEELSTNITRNNNIYLYIGIGIGVVVIVLGIVFRKRIIEKLNSLRKNDEDVG
ncbi:MAG: hypothetical protein RR558_00655 [Coprobacillus sp.]